MTHSGDFTRESIRRRQLGPKPGGDKRDKFCAPETQSKATSLVEGLILADNCLFSRFTSRHPFNLHCAVNDRILVLGVMQLFLVPAHLPHIQRCVKNLTGFSKKWTLNEESI